MNFIEQCIMIRRNSSTKKPVASCCTGGDEIFFSPVLQKPKAYHLRVDDSCASDLPHTASRRMPRTLSYTMDLSNAMAQRQASNIPPSGPPFSKRKKLFITTTATWVTWNSNLGSSLPSNAATAIQVDLSIARGPLVWLNSLYMLGYAVGPLLFGPLSEHIGRRPVILYAYAGYMLCTMACALSDRFALLLAFRFLTGFVASAPNATVGGLLADAHPAQAERGRAMAYFTCAAVAGPLFGPLVSGFAQGHSWQLVFWVGFAIAGVGLPLPLLLPETFAPVLERRRARAAGEAVPGSSEKSLAAELRIVFTRPAVMMVREPIVLWTALYLALVYSILYLFFQAYPVIFQGVYDLSPGMIGLGYLPILAGILLALAGVFLYDAQLAQYQARGSRWASDETHRRLPLAYIGGPLVTLGLFWLGWSSTGTIHPALPLLSGLPFGAGYMLIFVAMVNHLSDAYRDFSASAHSAASTTRSLAAAFLPVAAAPMYAALGVPWACSLLGFAALALSAVPLIFVRFDAAIRRRTEDVLDKDASVDEDAQQV
ncbi:uncharacterized protein VDAG_08960 [Verticillium dahliae VdLs.17]|uniref:Major facilitator superfamily (MFS) profile domain-containing protein n=1 Tax=Verticillium dahliae (strain VdLs.17 / ATCC MYA-4575 / FGSC 10137) TaxID=498257 RepID=G2XFY1_VERDV|nr:uncharacterized protein VDAG_08960 [Verticillium dahliae VdLs.17]EGY18800.1 hypothetical protein VDAG_08960 [Verticillium dahliae VdLs.17]KAH6702499.1 major facilitator superfamily domain-containing protein [Verticillium dahliae]